MYILKNKSKKGELKDDIVINGLTIKLKNTSKKHNIKSVIIVDKKLKSKYANKQMEKILKKVYDKIFLFLTSDDDSENGIKICLGEIEKCKSALFNKYKEALTIKKYKEFLTKIVLCETEFKEKYYEREYYANLINKMYRSIEPYEEELRGKSR